MSDRMMDDFDGPWLGQYILGGEDGHTPVPCYELYKWAAWLEVREHRSLWWTGNSRKYVSTIFTGLNSPTRALFGGGPPELFETMAFQRNGRMADWGRGLVEVPDEIGCQRYSSWDDAEIGHKAMVRKHLINRKTRVNAHE